MQNPVIYAAIFALGGLSLATGAAMAQGQRPPAPDLAAVASALDVPQDALMRCLGERPEPGQRPPKPDASKVSECLGGEGFKVTTKAVDKALVAASPKRG